MKQSIAADSIDAAAQSEIFDLSRDHTRWLCLLRHLLTNGIGEFGHVPAQLIKNHRAASARRQNARCANPVKRTFRINAIKRIVQQLLLKAVAIERMQVERF